MKPLLLIYVLLLGNTSFSQNNITHNRWSGGITTNLAIPGSSILALQPCVEYKINNRFSGVAGYSFKFIDIDKSENSISNQKYSRWLIEGRFRFDKHEYKPAVYIGLQTTLSKRKFIQKNGSFLYEFKDDSTTYFTKANVSSPVTTLSIQMGLNTFGKKRFFADFFVGAGVRFTNTKFSNEEGKMRKYFIDGTYEWVNITTGLEIAQPSSFIHITGGVRLFYHFKME